MPSDDDIQYIDRKRLKWNTNDKLGEGSFGVVYRGYYNRTPAAIKVVRRSSQHENPTEEQRCLEVNALKQHRREIHRFKVIQNPYIIQYLGVFRDQDPHDLYIVTEYLEGGSLYDSLRRMRDRRAVLHDNSFLQVALNIAMGLTHVHSEGYTHGDVKPQNVLLTSEFEFHEYPMGGTVATIAKSAKVKIADFGLSKRLNQSSDQAEMRASLSATSNFGPGPCGTFLYMSPEAYNGVSTLRDDEVKASDVYAYGLILFELLSGLQSWQLEQVCNPVQLYNLVVDGKRPSWGAQKEHIRPSFIRLVESCWSHKCSDRPTVDEILETLHDLEDEPDQLPPTAPQSASKSASPATLSPNTSQVIELPSGPGRPSHPTPNELPKTPPNAVPNPHPQVHPPGHPTNSSPVADNEPTVPRLQIPSRDAEPRAAPQPPPLQLPPRPSFPMNGQPSPQDLEEAVVEIASARPLSQSESHRDREFPNSIPVQSVDARPAPGATQPREGDKEKRRPVEQPRARPNATEESVDLLDVSQVGGVPIRKVGSALEGRSLKQGPNLQLPEGPGTPIVMGSFETGAVAPKRSDTARFDSFLKAGNGGSGGSDANPGSGGLDIQKKFLAPEEIPLRNGAGDGPPLPAAHNQHGIGQEIGLMLPLPAAAPRSGGGRRQEPVVYNGIAMGGERSRTVSPVKDAGEATTPPHATIRYKSRDVGLNDDQLLEMFGDTREGAELLAGGGGCAKGVPPPYGTIGQPQQPNVMPNPGGLLHGVQRPDMGGEKLMTGLAGWGNPAVMQSGNLDYIVQNALLDSGRCESVLMGIWQSGHYRAVASGLTHGGQLRGEEMLKICCCFLRSPIGRQDAVVAKDLCTAIGNVGRNWTEDDARAMVTKDVLVDALRLTLEAMSNFLPKGDVLATCNYALCNLFKINNVIEDVNLRRSIASWILHTLSWNLLQEGNRPGPLCPLLAYTASCAARNFMWKNEANVLDILAAKQQRLPAMSLFTQTMNHFEYLGYYLVVESSLSALAMLIHFPNHRLEFAQQQGVETITYVLLAGDGRMTALAFSMLVILFSGPNPRLEEVELVSKSFSTGKCAPHLMHALDTVRRQGCVGVNGEEERERHMLETMHRGFSAVLGGIRYSPAVMNSLAGSNVVPLVIESLKDLARSSRVARDAIRPVTVPGIAEARRQLGVVLCEIVREFSRDNRLLLYMREACVEHVLGELSDVHAGSDLVASCRMALAVL